MSEAKAKAKHGMGQGKASQGKAWYGTSKSRQSMVWDKVSQGIAWFGTRQSKVGDVYSQSIFSKLKLAIIIYTNIICIICSNNNKSTVYRTETL
jgi:hypothetical protein